MANASNNDTLKYNTTSKQFEPATDGIFAGGIKVGGGDWIEKCLMGYKSNYSSGSMTGFSYWTLDVTVPGANPNEYNICDAGVSPYTAGYLFITAQCVATDTVRVTFNNATPTTISLTGVTVSVMVRQVQGPFVPNDIAGLRVWLAARSLGLANGASVSSWTDLSGNGNNAVQATGANQPVFQTAQINSLPAVYFNSKIMQGNLTGNASTDRTIFYVIYVNNNFSSWFTDCNLATGNYNNGFKDLWWNGRRQLYYTEDTGTVGAVGAAGWRIHSSVVSNSQRKMYGNPNTLYNTQTTTGAPGTPTAYTLGNDGFGTYPWIGWLAEVLWYDTLLSDSDRVKVENYLRNIYAL